MKQATLVTRNTNSLSRNDNMSLSRKRPAPAVIDLSSDSHDDDNNSNHNANGNNNVENTDAEFQETIGPVPFPDFLEMWKAVEEDDGWETSQFEETNAFRRANTKISDQDTDGHNQVKAQYGRISFQATRAIFKHIAKLKYFQVFLDIGHGVGNTVLQAAYTVGSESCGIELVALRHERAEVYREKLQEHNDLINRKRDGKNYTVGRIRMRHGSLKGPEHRSFLTQDVDVTFCNNFNEVFGLRCVDKPEEPSLDMHLAALFASMKPGASFLTLHPLPLPPCLDEANMIRKRLGLQESEEASFYNVEEYNMSGTGLLSWTNKDFTIYKYTRTNSTSASFLCCNTSCDKARNMQAIPATKIEGDYCLMNHCDCNMAERMTRNTAKYQCPRFDINVDEDGNSTCKTNND